MASLVEGTKRTYATMAGETSTLTTPSLADRLQSYSPRTTVKASTPISKVGLDSPYTDLSGLRSGSGSPRLTPSQPSASLSRSFESNASIVLVGVRGTGKSTLGVIASTTFQRRLVETEYVFQETTGHSSATYRKLVGPVEHQRRQIEILKSVLSTNGTGCVIVCGTEAMERSGQALLRDFARTHPVIHIVRDAKSIQSHLKVWEEGKIADLLRISGPMFRNCSNFEYYNITENGGERDSQQDSTGEARQSSFAQQSSTPFLTLKRAERHFLKFIALVTAQDNEPASESAYPLSQFPAEARSFTYSVSVPLFSVLSEDTDIEELETGSDAFELVVDNAAKGLAEATDTTTPPHASVGFSCIQAEHISRALARVRRKVIVPILYHVDKHHLSTKSSATGVHPQDNNLSYLELVRHGLRLAPEFATLDLSLSDEEMSSIINIRGSTKMIAHIAANDQALPGWDDSFWLNAYKRAKRLGFALVRFSRDATSMEDNHAVQRFREKVASLPQPHLPLIAYNSGRHGRTSACFNPILTPVTHQTLPDDPHKPSNTPCITARQATEALYASFVLDPMRFYVIGASAAYSLSPTMHNVAYASCGMPHSYQVHETPSLNNIHGLIEDPHFGGASIALPFKLEIIALTHSISRHARAIGAVNTLIPVRELRPDGTIPDDLSLFQQRNRSGPVKALYGENTDWIGIRACIRRGLSPVNAVRPRTSALIIGAGGMARAAVYAALQLGVKNVVIYNRTVAHAEKVAAHYSKLTSETNVSGSSSDTSPTPPPPRQTETVFHVLRSRDDPWPETLRQPTIVVSCIPTHAIGDNPAPNFTLPTQWLKSPTGGVVLEIGYRFLKTPLLEQVRAESHRGWVAMDGLDLLPEQGFAQFELFTGRRAPRRLMRAEVLRSYRDEEGRSDPSLIQSRLDHIDEQEP